MGSAPSATGRLGFDDEDDGDDDGGDDGDDDDYLGG